MGLGVCSRIMLAASPDWLALKPNLQRFRVKYGLLGSEAGKGTLGQNVRQWRKAGVQVLKQEGNGTIDSRAKVVIPDLKLGFQFEVRSLHYPDIGACCL